MEDEDEFTIPVEDEVTAAPWLQVDTTAVLLQYAAHLMGAATVMFQNMSSLAQGQSALEWQQIDQSQFASQMSAFFGNLPEEEKKGDANG